MKQLFPLFILLIGIIFSQRAMAVEEIFRKEIKGAQVHANAKFKVKDDKYFTIHWADIDTILSVRNLVTLELNEDTNLVLPDNFTCSVDLRVFYWDADSVMTSQSITLAISYDSTRLNPINYRSFYLENDYFKDSVVVDNIVYKVNGTTTTAPKIFKISAEIHVNRIYEFSCTTAPNPNMASPHDSRQYAVGWNVFKGADEYDFEWTFYDDSSEVMLNYGAGTIFEDLFRNNATRVTTKQTTYSIFKLYPAGDVFYRVRAVHYDAQGRRKVGKWSNGGSPISDKFSTSWFFPDFNWTASTVFAEEGKKKESVSYFDGSQRNRQTVTTVNTDTFSIVTQTIYDHQGRPALSVLPTPVKSWSLDYHTKFNKYGSAAYDADQFDIGTCGFTPYGMDSSAGTSRYYSSNTESSFRFSVFTPTAKGYPFTLTEYTPDLTGRIRRQSNVGSALKLSSGHETKYYYGKPAQEELDRIFGNEAGLASHYLKNLAVDPNGQVSVSYLDAHNRTVATALTGPSPSNVDALPSYASPHSLTINLLTDNKPLAASLVNHYSLPSGNTGSFAFNYTSSKSEWEPDCVDDVCYDCYYNFLIRVTDDCGNLTLPGDSAILKIFDNVPAGNPPAFDTVCNSSTGSKSKTFTVTLGAGSYNIEKTATINQEAIEYYAQKYLEQNTCIIPYDTFLADAIDSIDFTGCNLTCDQCRSELGTEASYVANYIAQIDSSGKIPTALDTTTAENIYAQMVAGCNDLCNGQSSCDILYGQLLADVSIGGQYGTYSYDNTTMQFGCTDATSVFKIQWLSPDPYYQNENGDSSFVLYNDSLYYPQDVPLTVFLTNWNPNWAISLVDNHPEYCYWTYCELNSASEKYNDSMLSVNTFAEASTAGFLDPLAISGVISPDYQDPFFAPGGLGAGRKLLMRDSIKEFYKYSGDNYSMWEFVTAMVACDGDIVGCTEGFGGGCEGNDDVQWKMFRSLYLTAKYYFVDSLREVYVGTCDTSNACIGIGDQPWLISNNYLDTSDCTGVYAYGFQPHIIHWGTTGPTATFNSDTAIYGDNVSEFSDSVILSNCYQTCEYYADGWMAKLQGCIDPLDSIDVRAALIDVCKTGCSFDHPFGLSTLPEGVLSSLGYTSFAHVLDSISGIDPGDTSYCNAINLTINDLTAFAQTSAITVDDCLCDKITALKDTFSVTTNYQLLSDSLFSRYGISITAHALGMVDSVCSSAGCHYLPEPITLPGELSCFPGGCVQCQEFAQLNNDFFLLYGTTPFADFQSFYAKYLNARLGFALSYEDYAAFAADCDTIDIFFLGLNSNLNLLLDTFEFTFNSVDSTLSSTNHVSGIDLVTEALEWITVGPTTYIYLDTTVYIYCSGDTMSYYEAVNYFWMLLESNPLIEINFMGDPITFYFVCGTDTFCFFYDNPEMFAPSTSKLIKVVPCANEAESGDFVFDHILCNESPFPSFAIDTTDCMDQLMNLAVANAQAAYEGYIDSVTQNFITEYITNCMQPTETFTVTEPFNEHHYTLYYYDQSDNLIMTVPPRGVDTLSASEVAIVATHRANTSAPAKYPSHVDSTRYWYNSLNMPIKQKSPDASTSLFWYDVVGRLVVSQNGKQSSLSQYSYTLYDALGRITEVGQLQQSHAMKDDTSINAIKLAKWIANGTNRQQVTHTYYDASVFTIPAFTQENLRNRVASVSIEKTYDNNDATYDQATHYSYDIQGNVKILVQDIPALASTTQQYKRITYDYDLISGKVNRVYYQKDSIDAYTHKYTYDQDNRIIEVYTSVDNLLWDRDANYQYYHHGPLARLELGERQVQGIDYAYTIQGWLKSINGLNQNINKDMGRDGNPKQATNKKFGRDVYGTVLGYFAQDYYPAGGTTYNSEPAYTSTTFNSGSASLYNGNIRNMGVTIQGTYPKSTLGYAYDYDQLNRLKQKKTYNTFDAANYKWTTSGSAISAYREQLTYDANGNIATMLRRGDTTQVNMDNLTYTYDANTNQLDHVDETISAGNYPNDLDDQSTNNYLYDGSGNLIRDVAEGLDITWTAYGKVDSVHNSNSDLAIKFGYDAMQQRLFKRVIDEVATDTVTTYYLRDAQGNIMATYKLRDDSVRWQEHDLYGSARVGTLSPDSVLFPRDTIHQHYLKRYEGLKHYELTNHLGNVLAVINDRKIGKDTTTTTGTYDYWVAAVISSSDYYSFGMIMPGRNFSNTYSFGYNGKEKDDELKGIGNSYDYGMRIYDSRISRFLSKDPLSNRFPHYSPYQYAGNRPIWAIDLDGTEDVIVQLKYGEAGNIVSITASYQVDHNNEITDLKLHDAQNNRPYSPHSILVIHKNSDGTETVEEAPNINSLDNGIKKVIKSDGFTVFERDGMLFSAEVNGVTFTQNLNESKKTHIIHKATISSGSFNINPSDDENTNKATNVLGDLNRVNKLFKISNMNLSQEKEVKDQLNAKGVSDDKFTNLPIDEIPEDKSPKVVVGSLDKDALDDK